MACSTASADDFSYTREMRERRYDVRISMSVHEMIRHEFDEPVFLFFQRVNRIRSLALKTQLKMEGLWMPGLRFRVLLPVVSRRTEVSFDELLVSRTQSLQGQDRLYVGTALGEPSLVLIYRPFKGEAWAVDVEVGTRLAFDDSPQSLSVPARIPSGFGQNALLAGLSGQMQWTWGDLGLNYQLQFFPGQVAAYLTRKVGPQFYVNGALGMFSKHVVSASLGMGFLQQYRMSIAPIWQGLVLPTVRERGEVLAISPRAMNHELGLRVTIEFASSETQRFSAYYHHQFLRSWEDDPFFPMVVPEQGLGVAWQYSGL